MFAVLGAVGMAIIYGLKVNLSVAIVAMINHTHMAHEASLHHDNDDVHNKATVIHNDVDEVGDDTLCFGPGSPGYNATAEEIKKAKANAEGSNEVIFSENMENTFVRMTLK